MADRVMVTDRAQATALHGGHFFGKQIGPNLQLSLIEAAFLAEVGVLKLKDAKTNRSLTLASLRKRARELQPDFDLRLDAFKDMKAGGSLSDRVQVRFALQGYEGDPGKMHARYLVHASPRTTRRCGRRSAAR